MLWMTSLRGLGLATTLVCAVGCGPRTSSVDGGDTAASGTGETGTTTGAGTESDDGGSFTTMPTTMTASTSTTTDGTDEETGGVPELCDHLAQLVLSDPFATPQADAWFAGTSITVGATMTNPLPYGFNWYPGIRVSADHDGVTSAAPENNFFALLEDSSEQISVVFDAADDVPPDTVVTFTIEVFALNQDCPDADTIEVQATVK